MIKSTSEIQDFLKRNISGDIQETIDLLFPYDDADWSRRYFKGGVSTCALFAAAYYRFLGYTDREINSPYQKRLGAAVSDACLIAKRHKKYISGTALLDVPTIGDVLLIGPNEHVLIVSDIDSNSLLISGDGGQASTNTLKFRERMMLYFQNKMYLVDPEKPYLSNGSPNGRYVIANMRVNNDNDN